MEHVAIMRKSWDLTDKILTGQKRIESRWYDVKHKPWGVIKRGDIIYFKDSGGPARIKAEVGRVMQFTDLTPKKVKEILGKYGKADGIEAGSMGGFFKRFKNKKYCMLIFLKAPRKIKPFQIDKTGFGVMAAWITTDTISKVKKHPGA